MTARVAITMRRMMPLALSATKSVDAPKIASPSGLLKAAFEPMPSADPNKLPARRVVAPDGVEIARI